MLVNLKAVQNGLFMVPNPGQYPGQWVLYDLLMAYRWDNGSIVPEVRSLSQV